MDEETVKQIAGTVLAGMDDAEREEPAVAMSPRIVTITEEIGPETVARVIAHLAHLCAESEEDPIVIALSTNGGRYADGLALYDLIMTRRTPIATVAYGEVSSAGVAIFLGGHERFIAPNARLMIHSVHHHYTADMMVDLLDLKKMCGELRVLNRRLYRLIAARTKQPIASVRKWCEQSREFSAKEAVRFGFADHILKIFGKR